MKLKKLMMMAAGGSSDYMSKVLSLKPLAFWPLNEKSGSVALDLSGNGYNGAYTGVTLGQPGQGGQTCPLFDGTNSCVNIYSAGIAGAFNPNECTVSAWYLPNTGVLTDGAAHGIIKFQVDIANRVVIQKNTVNNQFQVWWEGSDTLEIIAATISTYAWHNLSITISKAADQVKVYVDGAQSGATQTGLQTWSGSLAATGAIIGASTLTPTVVWSGWLQYAGLWTRALSATEVATLAVI